MRRDLSVNEFVRGSPEPAVLRFIASYDGYRQRGGSTLGSYQTLAGGLHTSPALIGHDGAQSGIQLRLSPLGARALLSMPAGELTGIDLDAAEVFGPVANEIHERLGQTASWPERFTVLDCVLRRHMRSAQDPPGEIGFAWCCLLRSGGAMPIYDLAREVGWSDRHLASRFRTEIGLTPKTAARVIRFHRARRTLQAHPTDTTLADTAGIQAMATGDEERLAS